MRNYPRRLRGGNGLLLIGLLVLLWLACLADKAKAQEIPGKSQAKLVDLMKVDFRAHPELLPLVEKLNSTFQMLEMPERDGVFEADASAGALAPPDEGGARYRSLCTVSLISPTEVVTAGHCLHSKRERFQDSRVLRRHLYRVESGRLVRVGYEDYRLSGRVIASEGDLRILELSAPARGVPLFSTVSRSFGYGDGERFMALGYPNRFYGEPFVSVACRLNSRNGLEVYDNSYGGSDCPVQGGMSGGPQFLARSGEQIGVTSMSGGAGNETAVTGPKLTYALRSRDGLAEREKKLGGPAVALSTSSGQAEAD